MIILEAITFAAIVAAVMVLCRLAARGAGKAWGGVPTSGHIASAHTREAARLAETDRQNEWADSVIAKAAHREEGTP